VVEAAGITKPTLYHYFGSKQGLLRALLETYHAPLNEAIRTAAEYQGDLTRSLETLTQAYFDFARQHPRYYRMQLAMYFSPQDSEAFQQVVHWNEEQHRLVEKMFADAVQNHGNMRGRQRLYAATFIGLINTCIGMGLNGYLEMDDALTHRVVHQFQHGIYS
jgi:TetR/AcrR family transcriptional regulator